MSSPYSCLIIPQCLRFFNRGSRLRGVQSPPHGKGRRASPWEAATASMCRKSPPVAPFFKCEYCIPAGGKPETLLHKASEFAAHVAGFRLHLEGCRPNRTGQNRRAYIAGSCETRIRCASIPIICALVGFPRVGSMVLPKKPYTLCAPTASMVLSSAWRMSRSTLCGVVS